MRITAIKVGKDGRVSVAWEQGGANGRIVKRHTAGDIFAAGFADAMAATVGPALALLGIADNGGAMFRGLAAREKHGVTDTGAKGRDKWRGVHAEAFRFELQRNSDANTVGAVKTQMVGDRELRNRKDEVTLAEAPGPLVKAYNALIEAAKEHVKAATASAPIG